MGSRILHTGCVEDKTRHKSWHRIAYTLGLNDLLRKVSVFQNSTQKQKPNAAFPPAPIKGLWLLLPDKERL